MKPTAQKIAAPVLLHSIAQLVTLQLPAYFGPRRGKALGEIGLIRDGAVLISGGKIASVGTTREMHRDAWLKKHSKEVVEVDCRGKIVIPGFVDSHTHPVFVAPRLVDFEKRIEGATYAEIAEAGGGIRSSIEGVRSASKKELCKKVLDAFREMAAYGTTTIEAKSGYGLSHESEIKSLEAIHDAAKQWPGTVVSTFLGAHVPPPEHKADPDRYVEELIEKTIPEVARRKLAKYADVFCEHNAFTLAQTERILEAAVKHGLEVRAHVCQLTRSELEPFLRFRPASFDHMDFVSDDDVAILAKQDTIATLVPGANYFLATGQYPPARKLIDSGVPVALATDYNPGTSPTASMPMVLSIACTQMKMTPAETLAAAGINGAYALGLGDRKGSIEPGKDADLAIFQLDDYREIAYWFGANHCVGTMISGLWSD
ncbi:MAG: imidazolonepropionase [Terriglobia bacterium]|jgi:imidazolonepropionase|nr:imidazolonepropionase [Terriglobia bacterium]